MAFAPATQQLMTDQAQGVEKRLLIGYGDVHAAFANRAGAALHAAGP